MEKYSPYILEQLFRLCRIPVFDSIDTGGRVIHDSTQSQAILSKPLASSPRVDGHIIGSVPCRINGSMQA